MRHATPTATAPSRILIHAGSGDSESGHPDWRGHEDRELASCEFSDDDGVKEMADINACLERVLDKAPSDSSANLLLRKTKDGYKAFFRIRSAQTHFRGFMSGRRLIDVVERVMKDVRLQIDEWKEARRLVEEGI